MTFMLTEDKALRVLLQNLSVSDQKSENSNTVRPVGVWFGQPDQEIANQNYPYITIDMIDVQKDSMREMRGKVNASYLEEEARLKAGIADDAEIDAWEMDTPIPVNLDYQITTYSRHPRQDRELLAKVLYDRLPFRFGTLNCEDNTVRRLDVLDVAKRDVTEQAKRLFVNAITVRISSEIPQGLFKQLYKVLTVRLDGFSNDTFDGFEDVTISA
jgi:hypothetical protein